MCFDVCVSKGSPLDIVPVEAQFYPPTLNLVSYFNGGFKVLMDIIRQKSCAYCISHTRTRILLRVRCVVFVCMCVVCVCCYIQALAHVVVKSLYKAVLFLIKCCV